MEMNIETKYQLILSDSELKELGLDLLGRDDLSETSLAIVEKSGVQEVKKVEEPIEGIQFNNG